MRKMRSAVTRPKIAMLGMSALILLAIVGFSYREWRLYTAENADAARSTQIREAADRLLAEVLDAETGQLSLLFVNEGSNQACRDA